MVRSFVRLRACAGGEALLLHVAANCAWRLGEPPWQRGTAGARAMVRKPRVRAQLVAKHLLLRHRKHQNQPANDAPRP